MADSVSWIRAVDRSLLASGAAAAVAGVTIGID